MYWTHPLIVIAICAKYGMPRSRLTEVTGRTYRHDKSRISIMNVRNRYTHVPNMVSQGQLKKSYELDTKTCQKPYKFDLKVKDQGRIWIMNVRDTSSHGDSHICQIW